MDSERSRSSLEVSFIVSQIIKDYIMILNFFEKNPYILLLLIAMLLCIIAIQNMITPLTAYSPVIQKIAICDKHGYKCMEIK